MFLNKSSKRVIEPVFKHYNFLLRILRTKHEIAIIDIRKLVKKLSLKIFEKEIKFSKL